MELYGIIHQHYNMNPCEKKEIKKENKISKKVLTVRKIGDKVLLVFEKQDKTQEAEKRKRKKLLKKVVDKEKKL